MTSTPHDGMVWVIGLNRTGTTSLAHALYLLGYPNLHYPDARHMLARDRSIFEGWAGGSDISVAAFYEELDGAYPGSLFILSKREPRAWLASCRDHFAKVPTRLDDGPSGEVRRMVYGSARPTDGQFLAAHERHTRAVRAYFDGRDDYLEMDVTAGDGWETLCPFLGVPAPQAPFPNTNRADGRDAHGSLEAVQMHHDAAAKAQRRAGLGVRA